jgi:hypothetical protein
MAINFLNTIDFNQNELLNPRIENQPNDAAAGTSVDGQLYFNTTTKHLMESNGSGGWKEVGGGVETLTAAQGTFISFTAANSATGDVDLGTFDLSAAGTPDATKYLRGDNSWEPITGIYAWDIAGDTGSETIVNGDTVTFAGGTYLTTAYNTSTNTLTIDHDATTTTPTTTTDSPGYGGTFTAIDSLTINSTGHVTGINTKTVTMPSAENYTWTLDGDGGNPQSIVSGDVVTFVGGTNITTEVNSPVGDNLTINLDDSITLAGELTVNGTGQSSFAGQVTIPTTPSAGTDAASKAYVDSLVAGGLTFRGTFNAATGEILSGVNSGSYIYQLTGTPPAPFDPSANRVEVKVGDYYIVATAGQFYGNGGTGGGGQQLDVGDSVIGFQAASANSSDKDDWSIVQSDEGVTDVQQATDNDLLGASVTSTGAGGTGSVTVGLDVDGLTAVTTTPDTSDTIVIYDTSASTNKKATLADIATAIDISKGVRISLSSTVSGVGRNEAGGLTTFDVNTTTVLSQSTALDVKAEIITSGGQTVYADITRSTNFLNVIFTGSVANGTYEALLVDVG